MDFTTKLDSSDNRQIKQYQLTTTQYSGTTIFGRPDIYITETGDTINVIALQNIQTKGLIFPVTIPDLVSGGTAQVLGRDTTTGKVVAISGGTGNGNFDDDYLTGGTFNTATGDLDLLMNSGSTVTVNLDGRYNLQNQQKVIIADYTILSGDNNYLLVLSGATQKNITVNDTLPDNFGVEFINIDTGNALFLQTGSGTLTVSDGTLLRENKVAMIVKIGSANNYRLKGELE
jgi:hypothetical protein